MLQNVAGCFDTSDCVEGRLFRPSLSVKHVANWTGIPTGLEGRGEISCNLNLYKQASVIVRMWTASNTDAVCMS